MDSITTPTNAEAFAKLADVHRGWCNYCKGDVKWCRNAPPGGCSLRDYENTINTPPSQTEAHSELLSRLRSSSAMLGMLPEDPGYNGSRLIIDDVEAARIAKDIDDAVAALAAAVAQERDAEMKYRGAISALELILPLAKGYAALHSTVKSSRTYIDIAEAAIRAAKEGGK